MLAWKAQQLIGTTSKGRQTTKPVNPKPLSRDVRSLGPSLLAILRLCPNFCLCSCFPRMSSSPRSCQQRSLAKEVPLAPSLFRRIAGCMHRAQLRNTSATTSKQARARQDEELTNMGIYTCLPVHLTIICFSFWLSIHPIQAILF